MTKKHFERFAEEIAEIIRQGRKDEAARLAWIVIRIASEDNPRFDANRFWRACGFAQKKVSPTP